MCYKPWRQFSGMSKHVLSNGDALGISGFTWMRSLTLISGSLKDLVLIYKNTWNDTLFSGNYISITWFLKCNLIGLGFPYSSVGKEITCNTGDPSSISGSGSSAGEGIALLQYSDLENSIDCIVHGVAKSQKQLSNFHIHFHTLKRAGIQSFSKNGKEILRVCLTWQLWFLSFAS